jgi:Fungal protein kinase
VSFVDDVAYVWWYDNEGAIQSYGINFVEDLPYFLVLLLCFDRFTTKDWGIITEFTEGEAGHCVLSLPSLDSSCPDSTFTTEISQTDKIRDHFGIVGRATRMLSATSQSTISGPQGKSRNLKDMELVIKISWPETSLMDEAKIIEKANRIADQNEHVKGHIPDLIWSCNFAQYSTREIRATLGIKSKSKSKSSSKVKSHRVLRIMLFRRLYPITDLTGDRFWKAFWQCFRCKCL